MLPTVIVKEAIKKNLDLISICDHNSVENVEAVRKAGEKQGLAVIGGVEMTSREEVHILGLFGDEKALWDIQNIIYLNLPGKNDRNAFGEQLIVDEKDNIININERLLIGATGYSVEEIVAAIHDRGGLAIASHIDRESFGILGQLGIIPPALALDALELSAMATGNQEKFRQEYDFPFVTSSDAHYVSDIGKSCTSFFMEKVSIEEIRKALQGKNRRRAIIE